MNLAWQKTVWWCHTEESSVLWLCSFWINLASKELINVFQGRWQSRVVDINLLTCLLNHRFILTVFRRVSGLFSKGQLDLTISYIFRFPSLSMCHMASVDGISVSCCSKRWRLHVPTWFSEIGPYLKTNYQPICVILCQTLANRTADYCLLNFILSSKVCYHQLSVYDGQQQQCCQRWTPLRQTFKIKKIGSCFMI